MPLDPDIRPEELQLFFYPKNRLRLTVRDRSYYVVKPVWAAPYSHPGRWLALLDAKDKEIVTLEDPRRLTPESWSAVQEELRRRYLTATISQVLSAKVEFGATYWNVLTDRGARDFVTQSLQENAIWLDDHHLLLQDVDGNRFEIPDVRELDARSRRILAQIL